MGIYTCNTPFIPSIPKTIFDEKPINKMLLSLENMITQFTIFKIFFFLKNIIFDFQNSFLIKL